MVTESLIGLVAGAVIKAVLDWLVARKGDQLSKEAGALEASNETKTVIAEIADERSKIPAPPSSASALAASLRKRAEGA